LRENSAKGKKINIIIIASGTLALALLLAGFIFAAPLAAGETLMSRSGLDFWLREKTQPRDQKLDRIESRLRTLEIILGEWEYANCERILLWPGSSRVELFAPDGVPKGSFALDSPPVIVDGRAMVPLRFIGEVLGAEVFWDEALRKVTYISGTRLIELTVGQPSALVGGRVMSMDAAPLIINSRTMVPVRFVSQWLGAVTKWDDIEKKVEIIYIVD